MRVYFISCFVYLIQNSTTTSVLNLFVCNKIYIKVKSIIFGDALKLKENRYDQKKQSNIMGNLISMDGNNILYVPSNG